MKTASITEAKNQLSALLERVRAGKSVVILDRGVAVARLTPVADSDDATGRLQRLERAGIIRVGRAAPPKLEDLQARAPRLPDGVSAVAALIEERRTGR